MQQVVVRLPPDLADGIDRLAAGAGKTRSEIVREALRAYLGPAISDRRRPAERVAHLIGALETGLPDLAQSHREYVLESIRGGR
jgi:metal-responsive CopG/Arc/MetJ family transcriptional regulator